MKSTLSCFALVGLLAIPAGSGLSVAAANDREGDSEYRAFTQQGRQDDATPSGDRGEQADQKAVETKRRGPMSRAEQVEKLTKLQEEMREQIELTRTQSDAIELLFEEQLDSMKGEADREKRREAQEDELEAIRDLREELVQARKAGDKERARELRRQMSEKLRERSRGMALPVGRFLEKIVAKLDHEQESTFQTLVKRLGLDRARRPRGNPMGHLMRAVMNPEVGLSREQRRAVRDAMREHASSIRSYEMEEGAQEEATAKLRDAILSELTPEQRAKAEAKLEEYKKEGPRARPDRPDRRVRIREKEEEAKAVESPEEDD